MDESTIEQQKHQDLITSLENQLEQLTSELAELKESSNNEISKLKADHSAQIDAKEKEIKSNAKKTEGAIENYNDVVKRLKKEVDEKVAKIKKMEEEQDKTNKDQGKHISHFYIQHFRFKNQIT